MKHTQMSVPNTETSGRDDVGSRSKANQITSTVKKRREDGSVAILAGSAMFVWALKTFRKSKVRATLLVLACCTVFGIGIRQRRVTQKTDRVETEEDIQRDKNDEMNVSGGALAEDEQDLEVQRNADELHNDCQSETESNPQDVSEKSDTQMDNEGDVDLIEGKEPAAHQETNLDESTHDTRLHSERDDDRTEVDLSERVMADEASESAGPYPEQAYPAHEGTDPELTPEEAPEWIDQEGPTRSPSEDREPDDETRIENNGSKETADESEPTEEQQEAGDPAAIAKDPVLVPPEPSDELEMLYEAGELDPEDRDGAIEQATNRGFDKAEKWLEQVGDKVYAQAARGEFVAGDEV